MIPGMENSESGIKEESQQPNVRAGDRGGRAQLSIDSRAAEDLGDERNEWPDFSL